MGAESCPFTRWRRELVSGLSVTLFSAKLAARLPLAPEHYMPNPLSNAEQTKERTRVRDKTICQANTQNPQADNWDRQDRNGDLEPGLLLPWCYVS